MFKRVVAICLIIASVSANFSRFIVCAGFEINRNYIAKELCENKSRPWMNCNGRCYLMKKLKQAEEKEKKQEQEDKRSQYQDALPAMSAKLLSVPKTAAKRKTYPLTRVPGISGRASSIFQPPKVA